MIVAEAPKSVAKCACAQIHCKTGYEVENHHGQRHIAQAVLTRTQIDHNKLSPNRDVDRERTTRTPARRPVAATGRQDVLSKDTVALSNVMWWQALRKGLVGWRSSCHTVTSLGRRCLGGFGWHDCDQAPQVSHVQFLLRLARNIVQEMRLRCSTPEGGGGLR